MKVNEIRAMQSTIREGIILNKFCHGKIIDVDYKLIIDQYDKCDCNLDIVIHDDRVDFYTCTYESRKAVKEFIDENGNLVESPESIRIRLKNNHRTRKYLKIIVRYSSEMVNKAMNVMLDFRDLLTSSKYGTKLVIEHGYCNVDRYYDVICDNCKITIDTGNNSLLGQFKKNCIDTKLHLNFNDAYLYNIKNEKTYASSEVELEYGSLNSEIYRNGKLIYNLNILDKYKDAPLEEIKSKLLGQKFIFAFEIGNKVSACIRNNNRGNTVANDSNISMYLDKFDSLDDGSKSYPVSRLSEAYPNLELRTNFGTPAMYDCISTGYENLNIDGYISEEQEKVLKKARLETALGVSIYENFLGETGSDVPDINVDFKMKPVPIGDVPIMAGDLSSVHHNSSKESIYFGRLVTKYIVDNTYAETEMFNIDNVKMLGESAVTNVKSVDYLGEYNYTKLNVRFKGLKFDYLIISDGAQVVHSCIVNKDFSIVHNKAIIYNSPSAIKIMAGLKSLNYTELESSAGVYGYEQFGTKVARILTNMIENGISLIIHKDEFINFNTGKTLLFTYSKGRYIAEYNNLSKVNKQLLDYSDTSKFHNELNGLKNISVDNKAKTINFVNWVEKYRNELTYTKTKGGITSSNIIEYIGVHAFLDFLNDADFVKEIGPSEIPQSLGRSIILYKDEKFSISEYYITKAKSKYNLIRSYPNIIEVINVETGEVLKDYRSEILFRDYVKYAFYKLEFGAKYNSESQKYYPSASVQATKLCYTVGYINENSLLYKMIKFPVHECESQFNSNFKDMAILGTKTWTVSSGHNIGCGVPLDSPGIAGYVILDFETGYLYFNVCGFSTYKKRKNGLLRCVRKEFGYSLFKLRDLNSAIELVNMLDEHSDLMCKLAEKDVIKEFLDYNNEGIEVQNKAKSYRYKLLSFIGE